MPNLRLLLLLVFLAAFIFAAKSPQSATLAIPTNVHQVPIIDLLHTSWTAREGAPAGIRAIAQTNDGWIWIGSSSGLYKFDGVRFIRATGSEAPMSASVSMIGVLRDGSLWVGYKYGGFSLMRGGRMRHYRLDDPSTPSGSIQGGAQDAIGNLWVATGRGMRILDTEGVWHIPPTSLGIPDEPFFTVLLDSRGVLWIRGFMNVFALSKGAAKFERKMVLPSLGSLAQHPDGSVWTVDSKTPGMFMLAPPDRGVPLRWNYSGTGYLLVFDRAGFAWTNKSSGVSRIGSARLSLGNQSTATENGLSGVAVDAIFEDRERNIWIGTNNGLDRFEAPRLRALPLPLTYRFGYGGPVVGGAGSSAWIDGMFVASLTAEPKQYAITSSKKDIVTALFRAPDGAVWAGGNNGRLWVVSASGKKSISPPAGIHPFTVYGIGQGPDDTLWISMGRYGLYTWHAGRWSPGGGIAELSAFAATSIATDNKGQMWFGSVNDQIAVLDGARVRRYGHADGLSVGTVVQVLFSGDGAWIGGENGIAYFDGRRFTTVLGHGSEPFAGVTGMIFARDGALWINGSSGLSSIDSFELDKVRRASGYAVRFRRLDYRDGLTGSPSPILPVPTVGRSDDGTLWFSTTGGIFAFDPVRLSGNATVSPVVIIALKTGAQNYAVDNGTELPAGTKMLQIDFTALSYRVPERMGFRYRLEGVDKDWRQSEGQRSAYYTNLDPGHYVFRVMASNEDGAWNRTAASMSFDIAPSLTQMTWFRILCVLATIPVIWGAHLQRTYWVTRRLASRMGERLAERERIARELHDTLLQSIQGLTLILWSAARKLAPEVRAPLEDAINLAEEVLVEGRNRVAGLRATAVPGWDIVQAVRALGESLAYDHASSFDITSEGEQWKLKEPVADEVFAITREALRNAFVHAKAQTISVKFSFSRTVVVVTVSDDGSGLPSDVVRKNGREFHWGIPGMYERAASIGATLTLTSRPRFGTTWALAVSERAVVA